MMKSLSALVRCLFACISVTFSLAPGSDARAANYTVLHDFKGGTDGAVPRGALIPDNSGNLYGITEAGGTGKCSGGCGTIFEFTSAGVEKVLHSFGGGTDGSAPLAALAFDASGNLYGTTSAGGGSSNCAGGCGTLFKYSRGKESVLFAFQGGTDGRAPAASLIADQSGNLYGTTSLGGLAKCGSLAEGCGTVFKLSTKAVETVLHAFTGDPDGEYPESSLIMDQSGDLFGTTLSGGSNTFSACAFGSCGTLFEQPSSGKESVLYSFCSMSACKDGGNPEGNLTLAQTEAMFGVTLIGGGRGCSAKGCGTVFDFVSNAEHVIYAFAGGSDGEAPQAGITFSDTGSLFGTTCGRNTSCGAAVPGKLCSKGCGSLYSLQGGGGRPAYRFALLHTFAGKGGVYPAASLLLLNGGYYGTMQFGGSSGHGVIFELTN